jgi:hypothetical protein
MFTNLGISMVYPPLFNHTCSLVHEQFTIENYSHYIPILSPYGTHKTHYFHVYLA